MSIWKKINQRSEGVVQRTEDIANKEYEEELQKKRKELIKKQMTGAVNQVNKIKKQSFGNYVIVNQSIANMFSDLDNDLDPFDDFYEL